MTEKKAPAGYRVADPVEFVVDLSGNVLVDGEPLLPADGETEVAVTMVDRALPDEVGPSPAPSGTATPTSGTPSGSSVSPHAASPTRSSTVPTATRSLSRTGVGVGVALVLVAGMLAAGAGALVLRRREG